MPFFVERWKNVDDYRCFLRLNDNPYHKKAIEILENRDKAKYKDKASAKCKQAEKPLIKKSDKKKPCGEILKGLFL